MKYLPLLALCFAIYDSDHVVGLDRVCIYTHGSEAVSSVIPSSQVCPVYLWVEHG